MDDAKVSDHHAIIPTVTSPDRADLSPDEQKIYDLICRRLLSAWHEDHIWSVTTVITAIANGEIDRPLSLLGQGDSAGRLEGARSADGEKRTAGRRRAGAACAGSRAVRRRTCSKSKALKKKTRAPKRFTEATLLTAMETAGKTLDEKELSDAMKESGLGTPATRAAIIEVLLKREYIVRNGKSLEATDKGIQLIEVVHPEVKSPAMTGQWEAYLKRIERGEAQLEPFLDGIEEYVREVVGKVGQMPVAARQPAAVCAERLFTRRRCRRQSNRRVARGPAAPRLRIFHRSAPIRKRSAAP